MIKLKIEGMTCPHCVNAVKEALSAVSGVSTVSSVDLETGTADVEGNAEAEALVAAVKEAGYDARTA